MKIAPRKKIQYPMKNYLVIFKSCSGLFLGGRRLGKILKSLITKILRGWPIAYKSYHQMPYWQNFPHSLFPLVK